MQYVTDINEVFRLLSQSCGEPVYKTIAEDKDGNDLAIPVFEAVPGFYDTVEGCTLSHCNSDIREIACTMFRGFTDEEKHELSFSPKDGEFVNRAHFWANRLETALSQKQRHIAMCAILHWYIHIKNMRVLQKEGAA